MVLGSVGSRRCYCCFGPLLRPLLFLYFCLARNWCMCAQGAFMQLFTTAEAAAYLPLKERKIYEMAAEGTVPCTKVTGRWLFPKAELDHWLASSVTRPAGSATITAPAINAGRHDPLPGWGVRGSG